MTDDFAPVSFQFADEQVEMPQATLPTPAVTPNEQPEDSLLEKAGDVIVDAGLGVVDGLAQGGQAVADLTVGNVVRGGIKAVEAITGEDIEYDGRAPDPVELSDGLAGDVTNGLTRFALGYATGSNVLRSLGWAKKGKKAWDYARAFTAGGLADFSMFQGDEGRLADVAAQYPALDRFIPEYLESDKDDSEFEGRIKNMIEGGVLGVGLDTTWTALKGIKAFRRLSNAGKEEEALEALAESKMEVASMLGEEAPAQSSLLHKVSPEDHASIVEKFKARLNETGDIERAIEQSDFNFSKFDLDDNPIEAIKAVSEVMSASIDETVGGTRDFARVIKDAADMYGMGEAEFAEAMANKGIATSNLDSSIVAMKGYVQTMAKQADEANKLLFQKPDNVEAQVALGKSIRNLAQMQMSLKEVQTNTARGLNAHKIVPGDDMSAIFADKELEELVNGTMSPDKVRILSDRLKFIEGKPHEMTRVVRHGFGRFVDLHNEYWQNAILSGPGTQEIAFVSNTLKSLSMDVDRMIGGAIKGDKELAREGVDMIVGQLMNIREGMRMAGKSFKAERNFGDPEGMIDDVLPSRLITKGNGKMSGNGVDGMFINSLGRVINSPRQALGAQDEFFKTMNYRAFVRAKALREARAQGLDKDKTAELIQRRLSAAITEDGRFIDKDGRQFSRESTFTTDLGEGTIGQSIQEFAVRHPTARIFAPFIRTPVNLFREVHRRTPLIGRYQFQQAQRLAKGGDEAAIAKAEIAQGYAFYGMAALAVSSGNVTGKAPSDPALREAFYGQGKKEYSVLIDGKWHPYRKLDPFGSFLGLVADGVTISGELDMKEWEETIPVIIGSISSNLSSKTFLSDSIEKLNALTSGEGWQIDSVLRQQFGSYMPNALRQTNNDPYLREARSYMDNMMRGIRGFSETLQPRRNVFGEPIEASSVPYRIMHPFVGSDMKNDKVYKALEEVGKGIPMLPKAVANGRIDLEDPVLKNDQGQTPFDRWAELMSNPVRRKTLRQSLEQLIDSSQWDKLSDSTDMYSAESTRYKAVMARVEKYRAAHFQQVLREFPQLRNAMRNDKMNKVKAARGDELLPLFE